MALAYRYLVPHTAGVKMREKYVLGSKNWTQRCNLGKNGRWCAPDTHYLLGSLMLSSTYCGCGRACSSGSELPWSAKNARICSWVMSASVIDSLGRPFCAAVAAARERTNSSRFPMAEGTPPPCTGPSEMTVSGLSSSCLIDKQFQSKNTWLRH